MDEIEFKIAVNTKQIDCILTRARENLSSACLVIGHGASGDSKSGNLPAIAASMAGAGFSVLRYNTAGQLPARIRVLQGLLDSGHSNLKDVKRWILCGHSMGGRTACSVARTREDISAVILFSFPLHPPGKPDQLRDEDLTALQIPILIVRGTKDPFSTDGPFNAVKGRMASQNVEVETVEKGDHSLSSKTGIGKQRYDEWIKKVIQFSKKHTKAASEKESEDIDPADKDAPKRKRQKK